ncbi:MAG: HD domain-containing protein [bacterium]|nr:HD domain-containing protein [bacterium]
METANSTSPAFMERVIILAILIALLITHLFVVQKVAFLGFYYLPVLLAGYFYGKRIALLISILTLFLVTLYSIVEPGKMSPDIAVEQANLDRTTPNTAARNEVLDRLSKEKFKLNFSLVTWGAFLVLAAVISSVLYERKQKRVDELRRAYTGVVEILTKYLELANRSTVGRSRDVSRYATATARHMKLPEETIENIRMAALLHDLGHRDISALILEKSAELGKEANTTVRTQSIRGEEVIRSVSAVLEDVAPIVDGYHEYFAAGPKTTARTSVAKGSEIIAAARAYYDMITGSPTRKAWSPDEALAEIRTGKQFDADIIDAFEEALRDIKEDEGKEKMK